MTSRSSEIELAKVWNDQLPNPIKKIKKIKIQFTISPLFDFFLIR